MSTTGKKALGEYRLPRAFLNTGLDEIATGLFKNTGASDTQLRDFKHKAGLEAMKVGEGLIISPAVSFKVFGENVVLCMLINAFGIKAVEQLLEENALSFILWTGDIFKFKEPPKGAHPLMGVQFNTPHNIDPQASVELGLKGWSQHPFSALERISRLAIERTTLLHEGLPNAVVGAVYAAYNNRKLTGFEPFFPLGEMPPDQADKLHKLATAAMKGAVLLKNEYDLQNSPETWEALLQIGANLSEQPSGMRAIEKVLTLEGLPNLRQLMLDQIIPPHAIMKIRQSAATQEFRKWLWTQPDPADAERVARQYLSEITQKKILDRNWFKIAKMIGMELIGSVLGGAIGGAFAGTPGLVAGAATGLALSAVETFGFDKVLSGANPRRFADEELRPRVAERLLK